jgi:hypothetical protein
LGKVELPGSENRHDMNIAEIILKLQDISEAQFNAESFGLDMVEAYAPPKSPT